MEKKLEEVINRLEAVKAEVARLEAVIAELKAAGTASVAFSAEDPDEADPIDLSLDEQDFRAVGIVDETAVDLVEAVPADASRAESLPAEDLPVLEEVSVTADLPKEEVAAEEDIPMTADLPEEEGAAAVEDLPVEDAPVTEDASVVEEVPVVEAVAPERQPAGEEQPVAEPEESGFFDLFGEEMTPKPKDRGRRRRDIAEAAAEDSTRTVADAMTVDAAWRTDLPGTEVKSLRSAIALGDQVLFIVRLFRKDSALYQDTVDRLNGTATLAEAIAYLSETFPEWDLGSDDVYKFMMAVRRKIRR